MDLTSQPSDGDGTLEHVTETAAAPTITIPADLLPSDGRFGSGPSKVRPAQVDALAAIGRTLLGTSHRQAPVKNLVERRARGLTDSSPSPTATRSSSATAARRRSGTSPPSGWSATRAQHLAFGEFSSKFASGHPERPVPRRLRRSSRPTRAASRPVRRAGHRRLRLGAQRDLDRRHDAGEAGPGRRRRRARPHRRDVRAPAVCRSTSPRPTSTTSPRRSASPPTAASGSPRSRPRRWPGSTRSPPRGRWVPDFFSLPTAIDNSLKDQTYNTPPLATLALLAKQMEWLNGQGGLDVGQCPHRGLLEPALRLGRAHGIHDPLRHRAGAPLARSSRRSTSTTASTRPRSPGRCAPTESSTSSPTASSAATSCASPMFPAVDPDDVSALIACIEHVVDHL